MYAPPIDSLSKLFDQHRFTSIYLTKKKKTMLTENMTQFGSVMAGVMFVWAIFQRWLPGELRGHVNSYVQKVISYVYPYVEITFYEYEAGGWFERSASFVSIEHYLTSNSSNKARRLKANRVKDRESVLLSMDDHEQIIDEFNGIQIWWTSSISTPSRPALFSYGGDEEKRFYRLSCKRQHRHIITKVYLKHVIEEGKAIAVRSRQRKLYTNNKSENWYGYKRTVWSHILFEHPSTFDTLAMDPKKKKDILNDLITFSKSKDYYKKVGKSWKRGYLLYGPPGTGKSSMIVMGKKLLGTKTEVHKLIKQCKHSTRSQTVHKCGISSFGQKFPDPNEPMRMQTSRRQPRIICK